MPFFKTPRALLLCALGAFSLPSCAQPKAARKPSPLNVKATIQRVKAPASTRTIDTKPTAPGLDYRRSWVGNSYGTAGQKNAKWVQNNIVALWVAPDGRCYTASSWDEAKHEGGIYKEGDVVGNLADLHPDEGGGYGNAVSAVAGAGDSVYVGIWGNVRRYNLDGGHKSFEGGRAMER